MPIPPFRSHPDYISAGHSRTATMPATVQPSAILLVVFGIAIGLLLALAYIPYWKARHSREIRQDAILRSQATIAGQVHEQLLPFLPEFTFNPKDARFLGSPVDLVIFDGLDTGRLEQVIFLEVKTGVAGLTPRERQIRDAVRDGRVRWQELRVGPQARGGTG